jgi:hypothetical protein
VRQRPLLIDRLGCTRARILTALQSALIGCAVRVGVPDFTMHDTSHVIKNSVRLGGSSGHISKTTPLGAWYDLAVSVPAQAVRDIPLFSAGTSCAGASAPRHQSSHRATSRLSRCRPCTSPSVLAASCAPTSADSSWRRTRTLCTSPELPAPPRPLSPLEHRPGRRPHCRLHARFFAHRTAANSLPGANTAGTRRRQRKISTQLL